MGGGYTSISCRADWIEQATVFRTILAFSAAAERNQITLEVPDDIARKNTQDPLISAKFMSKTLEEDKRGDGPLPHPSNVGPRMDVKDVAQKQRSVSCESADASASPLTRVSRQCTHLQALHNFGQRQPYCPCPLQRGSRRLGDAL